MGFRSPKAKIPQVSEPGLPYIGRTGRHADNLTTISFFNTNRSKFGSKIAELNGGKRTSRISQIFLAPVLSLSPVPESDTREDWIPGMASDALA